MTDAPIAAAAPERASAPAPAAAGGITPRPRKYVERIGEQEWELLEERLDVHDEVCLWSDNPRVRPNLPTGDFPSEPDLEAKLQQTPGYDTLRRSIEMLGQMEPIYVWRPDASTRYTVFEGATRVAILRELDRKSRGGRNEGKFRVVRAKVLPENFGPNDLAILLARIHVRGSGVRAWSRYIQAKFIYETVVGVGRPALMNMAEMARHLEKSLSWVQRLRDAYRFALAFLDYVDADDAEKTAIRYFSVLEEVSKVQTLGPQLREYGNQQHDQLRAEVFDMIRKDAFKEYREARFLKEFHDDPEKWAQLKSGERHIATRLAVEVQRNSSSIKSKIASMETQIQRALEREDTDFGEDDVDALERAIRRINSKLHEGVRPFRVSLRSLTRALTEASLADVRALEDRELNEFREALGYFDNLIAAHRGRSSP